MAFITKQWLRHLPDRVCQHEPIQAELRFEDTTDEWCRTNRIKAAVKLHRDGGDYQASFLTHSDLTSTIPKLIAVNDAVTRAEVALSTLDSLGDVVATEVLAKYFTNRVRRQK